MIFYLSLLLSGFTFSIILTPILGKIAQSYDIYSYFSPKLKERRSPAAYLGGGALYFSLVFSLLFLFLFLGTKIELQHEKWVLNTDQILPIIIGSALVSFIGLIRDIRSGSFLIKLVFQILAAVFLIRMGIGTKLNFEWAMVHAGSFNIDILNILLTIFWVVVITNTISLLDVIEASGAGVSLIGFIIFFVLSLLTNNFQMASLAAIVIAVLLGFLIFNIKPASIVLGEMGGDFLGFILASIALSLDYSEVNKFGFLAPFIILFIPILITWSIIILSLKEKTEVYKEGRVNFFIAFLKGEFQEDHLLCTLYISMIVFGVIGIVIACFPLHHAALIVSGVLCVFALVFPIVLSYKQIQNSQT